MDRLEHAVRGRHGHRCHGAVRLRERLPAPGLSGRQGAARGLLLEEGHRERPLAHAGLGALAGAYRAVAVGWVSAAPGLAFVYDLEPRVTHRRDAVAQPMLGYARIECSASASTPGPR